MNSTHLVNVVVMACRLQCMGTELCGAKGPQRGLWEGALQGSSWSLQGMPGGQ